MRVRVVLCRKFAGQRSFYFWASVVLGALGVGEGLPKFSLARLMIGCALMGAVRLLRAYLLAVPRLVGGGKGWVYSSVRYSGPCVVHYVNMGTASVSSYLCEKSMSTQERALCVCTLTLEGGASSPILANAELCMAKSFHCGKNTKLSN